MSTFYSEPAKEPPDPPAIDAFSFLVENKHPGTEVIYDTGAAQHVLDNISLFHEPPSKLDKARSLTGIGGGVPCEGFGRFTCKAVNKEGQFSTYSDFAWYAPKCPRSLISTHTIYQDDGAQFSDTDWFSELLANGIEPRSTTAATKINLKYLGPDISDIEVPVATGSNLPVGVVC